MTQKAKVVEVAFFCVGAKWAGYVRKLDRRGGQKWAGYVRKLDSVKKDKSGPVMSENLTA